MKTSKIIWIVVVIVIIVLVGWYYVSMSPTYKTVTAPTTSAGLNNSAGQTNTGEVSTPFTLRVSTSKDLGMYLIAFNGMTLYKYANDTANVSNCSGACVANWPAYSPKANEPLVSGSGITGKLATITRADGTTQLTYNGSPVYFWKNDAKPGDTTGNGVGGVWSVVKP